MTIYRLPSYRVDYSIGSEPNGKNRNNSRFFIDESLFDY